MGKLNLQVKVHWGSLRERHRWLASFMTSSEMPFMGLSWFLWESRLRLRFGSRWFRLCRWVSARHAKLGKRDLSLYSQCNTYATLSPNCRDSVAWVSFRGDIASRCCRLSRTVAPSIDQNRPKNWLLFWSIRKICDNRQKMHRHFWSIRDGVACRQNIGT